MTVDEIYDAAMGLTEEDREVLTIRLSLARGPKISNDSAYVSAMAAMLVERVAEADRGEFVEGEWPEVIERLRNEV